MADKKLPPNTVLVKPSSFSVLGPRFKFRQSPFDASEHFNPSNTPTPFFQAFDESFFDVLGDAPAIYEVASDPDFAFAHEAPVYVADTDEIFFASNAGGDLGMSDWDRNNVVSKISLAGVEKALKETGKGVTKVSVPYTTLKLADTVQMTNGGTGPYKGKILMVTSGRAELPPSVVLIDPKPPYDVTVLLDNFFGRQFNSINDVKIHTSGAIFFTDPTYGWLNRFRPTPLLPNHVYRLDPVTGSVRVVADGIGLPNGIAFSPDGHTCYIGDTACGAGFQGLNQTLPATIYAFDIDEKGETLINKRVFAYADTTAADGINVDTSGNVYGSTGDGVHVWNSQGTLIGKIMLGAASANMAFAGPGRFVILAETKVFVAKIAAKGISLSPH